MLTHAPDVTITLGSALWMAAACQFMKCSMFSICRCAFAHPASVNMNRRVSKQGSLLIIPFCMLPSGSFMISHIANAGSSFKALTKGVKTVSRNDCNFK